VLPTFRRGDADVIEGSLESEAGIRPQL
jgi:hypothetical protein